MRRTDPADAGSSEREGQIALFHHDVVVTQRVPLLELHVNTPTTTSIEHWLPGRHARLRHARVSTAAPDDLWAAALAVRLRDTPRLSRLIRWRLGRHAPPPDTTFEE